MLKNYLRLPWLVHVLCLGALINRAGAFAVPFMTLYLTEQLNFTPFFATVAMGTFGLGSMAGSMLGGQLADRIGRKPVMIGALVGSAALVLVFSATRVTWTIPVVTFLLALVADTYRPAMSAMLADLVPSAQRPHAYNLMYVAANLGFAVAPAVAGVIAEYSFRSLFWGDAVTSLAFATIIALVIPESLRRASRQTHDTGAAHASFGESLSFMLRDRALMTFCTATFLVGVVYTQALSTLPLHVTQLGLTKKQFGSIIAWNGALIVGLQFVTTSLVIRFDRGRMLAIGSLLTAVGFGLTEWALVPWHFVATVIVWTFGEIVSSALLSPVIADMAPAERRAGYMGLLGMSFAAANTVGAPLGGFCLERLGATAIWRSSSAIGCVAALLYFLVRRAIATRPHATLSAQHVSAAEG